MARRARKRGRGMLIAAALLVVLLIAWGVARWRSAPSLVVAPGAPGAAERDHGGEHVTQEDRAALERVLRERAPAP